MPIRLSELTQGMRTRLRVEMGHGLAVEVEYRSGQVTPAYLAGRPAEESVAEFFAGIGLTWDIVDDDGTPVPITAEGLQQVPAEVVNRIFAAVAVGRVPNP